MGGKRVKATEARIKALFEAIEQLRSALVQSNMINQQLIVNTDLINKKLGITDAEVTEHASVLTEDQGSRG